VEEIMTQKIGCGSGAFAFLVLGLMHAGMGATITVDTVGVLDPNPNALPIVDATSNAAANGVTLTNFQTLMTSAFASNTGGVMDFQEQFQGGTWPNNPAGSPNNGLTVGNSSANTITATYGVSQSQSMSFFRNNAAADGIDAAVNQGLNVISGGGSTRNITQQVTYASSDPNVAVATNLQGNKSRVEAVGSGTATISATTVPASRQPRRQAYRAHSSNADFRRQTCARLRKRSVSERGTSRRSLVCRAAFPMGLQ